MQIWDCDDYTKSRGGKDMTKDQIVGETLRYLLDKSYNYAILIDGEWGCGKTYFVQKILTPEIEKRENKSEVPRKVKYVSLYGCKNIQDIQENIMLGFLDEAKETISNKVKYSEISKNKKVSEVGNNLYSSSKKIIALFVDKFVPKEKAFDITLDWLEINSYIFIFDDIERCDCPLNEVFGFINGLVEHEGVKVILVANEKEISVKEDISQKELQYIVTLNDRIKWPVKEDKYGRSINPEDKVTLEFLEEKRRLLFLDAELDETYRKIREKLIGVKLSYIPDTKEIITEIIEKSEVAEELKEALLCHLSEFNSFMDVNGHHNLRTFQFFISKVSYLYGKLVEIDIHEEYRKNVLSFLILDCFRWAVRFKGNVSIPTDGWEKAMYDAQRKSLIIKDYVESGEYEKNSFSKEIEDYIEKELVNKLADNDPLNLLYSQYYFHTQQWCEEKLTEIKNRLADNKYPLYAYQKIAILLVSLVEIGFPDSHIKNFKELMINNIDNSETSSLISSDLFFIENSERKKKVLDIIDDLNVEIMAKDTQVKQKTIEEILTDENWVKGLDDYTKSVFYNLSMDLAIFSKAPSKQWVKAIMNTTVEDIDSFRHWIHRHYYESIMREGMTSDLQVIKEIADSINLEEVSDLILKLNLSWLKEKMLKIVERYQNLDK